MERAHTGPGRSERWTSVKFGKMLGVASATMLALTALAVPASAQDSPFWSCRRVPAGYTYTMVRADQGCEPLYYVTLPRTGLWACKVTAGFTYTATRPSSNCRPDTDVQYLLAAE